MVMVPEFRNLLHNGNGTNFRNISVRKTVTLNSGGNPTLNTQKEKEFY